ncbi:MAG: DUF4129 domain-containing protein [Acidimicrobiales bacterium]|nr:DUF4129 domain-containing protein [Acidimicrobiales bacterium]
MSTHRPPMAQRTAYLIAAIVLALVTLSAFVSRNESREDFIIRMEAGDFRFNAPSFNPPDINGPNINGPNINAPEITFFDVLWNLFLIILAIGLIVGLIMVIRRYGPGSGGDEVDTRTTRLEPNANDDHYALSGEHGWAAFEHFCYQLMQDPDPGRAIRVAMRYAEAGFGRLEPRIADETPNEWHRRIAATNADLGPDLRVITQSYNSVRFGDATVRSMERDDAVTALRLLARSACGKTPPDAPNAAAAASGLR